MTTGALPPLPDKSIELLHVDEHVAVANKPSGLLVHRGWDNDDDVAMFRVRDALGGQHVHPMHRLDRGTSGALVFARTREAAALLARAFETGLVEKRYLALVRGAPPDAGSSTTRSPEERGRPACPRRDPLPGPRALSRRPLLARPRDARDRATAPGEEAPLSHPPSARGRREARLGRHQPPLPRDLRASSPRAARGRRSRSIIR